MVLDNFSAAVDKANNYDPLLNRTLAEYSQYRGFILDPARMRHPKDKPHTDRAQQQRSAQVHPTTAVRWFKQQLRQQQSSRGPDGKSST